MLMQIPRLIIHFINVAGQFIQRNQTDHFALASAYGKTGVAAESALVVGMVARCPAAIAIRRR